MTVGDYDAFYAIHDPHEPDRVTYWRRHKTTGELTPWPPNARNGPHSTPEQLGVANAREWNRLSYTEQRARFAAFSECRAVYGREVAAQIDANAETAQGRFAAFTTRCGRCGRKLTDPKSKTSGIGPECRRHVSAATLELLTVAVGRAHAELIDAAAVPA